MTQEEIVEGNKLISSEFLNFKIGHDKKGVWIKDKYFHWKDLKYHLSWDWIMPIGKKCSDITTNQDRPSINHCNKLDFIESEIGMCTREYDIEKTFLKIVEFIKLYNQK